jgi:ubiquinone/menaquinone biosynthesis C-methylase UbiE
MTDKGIKPMGTAAFWDKAAKKYAASPIKDIAAYEETLARTRHYLTAEDHLLEVGCGTGSTAIKLAPFVRRITATDISGNMIVIAQSKITGDGPQNIDFVESEINVAMADAPFDAVCAFSLLHLVDDLDQTLLHLRKQIKPGGYFISKTACLADMNMLIRPMIKVMQMIGKAPHVLVFDAGGLETAISKAGFDVVEAGYFGTNNSARFIVARRPS